MPLLEIKAVTKNFGGLVALDNVDLEVQRGEIFGLIGPNGAGKTTLFNVVSGVFLPTSGKVVYDGEDITGLPLHKVAGKGLVRTFQQTELFMEMTALENVFVAQHLRVTRRPFDRIFKSSHKFQKDRNGERSAVEILKFVGLEPWKYELAENLAHGHRRALGVAIALAAQPELLLMDEPLTGMHAEETSSMMRIIEQLKEKGMTTMLVEHNMRAVMSSCDKIAVLNFGMKIAEGPPEEIQNNKEVIDAYLGIDEPI